MRYEYKILRLSVMTESHLNLLALSRWRLIAVLAPVLESDIATFYLEREHETVNAPERETESDQDTT